MIDYYLKFSSQSVADKVLFYGKDSLFLAHSIDIIGTIYKPTGKTTIVEDTEQPVMAALTGWHVNVRGPENDILAVYSINVATPMRVWA